MSRNARIGLVVAVAALAVVAFVVLKPDGGDDKTTTGHDMSTSTPTQATGMDHTMGPEVVHIKVRDGEPVGGVVKATAMKDQLVRVVVSSDAAGELHVHGYNLTKSVPAGGKATIAFRAKLDGVFEIELHLHEGKPAQVASLKVEP